MTEVNEVNLSSGGGMGEDAGGGGGGGGKLIKTIIIAVVALVVIAGSAVAVWFFLGGDEDQQGVASQKGSAAITEENPLEDPVFLSIGTYIVNLADGRRYLKTNLELMLSEETAKAYLEKRIALVKDIVLAELQALSSEQLRDPLERKQLKLRLLGGIESLLPNGDTDWDDKRPIKEVLITEFYLQ
ncbi:MAG: flagellar basal body-associated FliL family protein [SAR324 cluster bacterium]|nr:flagellar basal body-associated FliL family protein [SAR324 cluster bacterium]